LVTEFLSLGAQRFVLDGEIAVPQDGTFSFDALLQRIHPAPSRVKALAADTPGMLQGIGGGHARNAARHWRRTRQEC
jgi:ATP-dependent DNA ligase